MRFAINIAANPDKPRLDSNAVSAAESGSPVNPLPATNIRFAVLALVAFASASAYLTRYCISVANTTIQDELGLSTEQMGWIFGLFAMGYFLGQVPGGYLGDRIGTRGAFASISVAWSLITVWTAATFSFLPLLLSRFVFGLSQAGLVPISASVINAWFPIRLRGTASAIIAASMSVGGVVTMALTASLLKHLDWRQVFVAYSLVGILWAAVFFLFFRTRPEDHPGVNEAELTSIRREPPQQESKNLPAETTQDHRNPHSSGQSSGVEILLRMLASRSMWGICIQAFFRAAGYMLFVTWFPAFLEKGYGVARASAGFLSSWPLAAVIAGSLAGGVIVDGMLWLTGNKWLSRSGVAGASLGLCGLLTLAASWSETPNQLVAVLTAGALFSGVANPAAWAATMDVAGRHTSIAMGTMNMAGTMGGFATPVVVGYLIGDIERTGGNWNQVIYLFAVIYLAGAATWLLVNPNVMATDQAKPK